MSLRRSTVAAQSRTNAIFQHASRTRAARPQTVRATNPAPALRNEPGTPTANAKQSHAAKMAAARLFCDRSGVFTVMTTFLQRQLARGFSSCRETECHCARDRARSTAILFPQV